MGTVTITRCTEAAQLWRRYEGQHQPQDAFLELDLRDGQLRASHNPEIGNATTFDVRHGFVHRWAIPVLTAEAANRTMSAIAPLAARMVADWELTWEGHNHIAVLGVDAAAAAEAIGEYLGGAAGYGTFDEADLVAEWGLDGAVNGEEAEEYGIGADTTDERIAQIAAQIRAGLAECGPSPVVVVPGLEDYLEDLRADARTTHV